MSLAIHRRPKLANIAGAALLAALLGPAGSAHAQDSFKLGIVTFLSGPAAESFGVPAANAARP